jgi:hypothetical protein
LAGPNLARWTPCPIQTRPQVENLVRGADQRGPAPTRATQALCEHPPGTVVGRDRDDVRADVQGRDAVALALYRPEVRRKAMTPVGDFIEAGGREAVSDGICIEEPT